MGKHVEGTGPDSHLRRGQVHRSSVRIDAIIYMPQNKYELNLVMLIKMKRFFFIMFYQELLRSGLSKKYVEIQIFILNVLSNFILFSLKEFS